MKRLMAIFLLITFVFANTSVGELWKVPNLMKHYKEHKMELSYTSISFMDFIKLHYAENSDHNHDEHHNLPFKTIESSSQIIYPVSFENIQIQITNFPDYSKKTFYYNVLFKSNLISTIWLPPKIA